MGFTVLEISKSEIFNFHYNFMIRHRQFMLWTSWKDFSKKMYKFKELFGLSNFPVKSKYYYSNNKKVVGKMKMSMVENQL